ncbi:hypothetical protein Poly59_16570 [Rubripirellula reticaptiva]|uniref:Uncharacterized protein n=1 Tax=Rubripirellula reticaptiva TaxID=2528013 RepID=A0A5C6F695_9BACT|nr:hypothetical protein Poly59_16570 [Rubripirellula reticaptiva]
MKGGRLQGIRNADCRTSSLRGAHVISPKHASQQSDSITMVVAEFYAASKFNGAMTDVIQSTLRFGRKPMGGSKTRDDCCHFPEVAWKD